MRLGGDCEYYGPDYTVIKTCAIDSFDIGQGVSEFSVGFDVNHPCIEPLENENQHEGFHLELYHENDLNHGFSNSYYETEYPYETNKSEGFGPTVLQIYCMSPAPY